jgi:ATP-binding cassette subfamily F protein 3
MIKVQNLTHAYGHQHVFRECNLHIGISDRIGLVGMNGTGKTTLLRLILGEEEPTRGEILKPKDLPIGYLPQNLVHFAGKTTLGLVMEAAGDVKRVERELQRTTRALQSAESQEEMLQLTERQGHFQEMFDHMGGYELEAQAKKILLGLGFGETDFHRAIDQLSGGWMMRALMARILLSDPDLILLDEPTNYLDLDSLLWLETYLTHNTFALVLVSHDRIFLNNVVNRIVEIDGGKLTSYEGNYEFYEVEREKRRGIEVAAFENQQERIREIQRFIERNRARKDRARQVQSRIKQLEKMERIDPPVRHGTLDFQFPESPRAPKTLIELKNLSKSYNGRRIYDQINLRIDRGDRVAFLGPNGVGKTTLMRILSGDVDFEGERNVGRGVRLAVFSQDEMDHFAPHCTVLEELETVAGDRSQGDLRNLLGSFLFRGEDVFKKVSVLSGGERSRLLLCRILVQTTNLLLLDEPTNHLDIPSREMLEIALQRYRGTLSLITHDRHLINRVATKVLVIRNQKVRIYPGNFDDYQSIWQHRELLASSEGEELPHHEPRDVGKRSDSQKRAEAEWRNRLFRETRPLMERLAVLEQSIEENTKRMHEIRSELAQEKTGRDPQRLQALSEMYHFLKNQVTDWTHDWESTGLKLEEIEKAFEDQRPSPDKDDSS